MFKPQFMTKFMFTDILRSPAFKKVLFRGINTFTYIPQALLYEKCTKFVISPQKIYWCSRTACMLALRFHKQEASGPLAAHGGGTLVSCTLMCISELSENQCAKMSANHHLCLW